MGRDFSPRTKPEEPNVSHEILNKKVRQQLKETVSNCEFQVRKCFDCKNIRVIGEFTNMGEMIEYERLSSL